MDVSDLLQDQAGFGRSPQTVYFFAVKMCSFCSLQVVGTKVVMFQADVDSWWNLSLGHAIPAFATRHARQEGNWDGFG